VSEKVCTRCNESKPFDMFTRLASSKDGHHSWCKKCRSSSESGKSALREKQRRAERKQAKVGSSQFHCWYADRPLTQQLLDVRLRKWGVITRQGDLIPSIGLRVAA